MAAAKPRKKATKAYKLPEPITDGFLITDTTKKSWIIGTKIGSGGFGTVYFAADAKKPKDLDYVVKVEYHGNGPLFAEMHCCQKIAKPASLAQWIKNKKLDYLGLSPCHGFGSFEFNNSKYRFMVIERFDTDLQKLLDENEKVFPVKTVCLIGISVLNTLEYIHESGYIHGDVKAANLLLGRKSGTENNVYLVDMGLACKYTRDGAHKANLPDPKKAHNGTPEFTSRDAHKGSFSRRSDLEILCYNLLQWLAGELPWERYISDNNKLQKEKERQMADVDKFLKTLFPNGNCPDGIIQLVHYVCSLDFEEKPDYNHCHDLLRSVLKSLHVKDNALDFNKVTKKAGNLKPVKKPLKDKENKEKSSTRQVKRKELSIEPGTILTPAMLEVMNKRLTETKTKSRKKS